MRKILEYGPEAKRQSIHWESPTSPSQSHVDHILQGTSSTANSCHGARRSISKSTIRSRGICFAQWVRRDEIYGRTNRSWFTSTIHLFTTSSSSWLRGASLYWNNLPILQDQKDHQVESYSRRGGHQDLHNDGAVGLPRRILPAVYRSALDWRGINLKAKPCSLLFVIEINCL